MNFVNCSESKREELSIDDLHDMTHEELEKLSKDLAKLYFQRLGRSSFSRTSQLEPQDHENLVRIIINISMKSYFGLISDSSSRG